MAEWRDSSRIDSVRSSMRNETSRRESDMRDSDQRDTDRPISTMLPYARSETSDPSPRPSEEREPAPSLAPAGLGLGIVSVDLTMPLRQRSLDRVEDSGARPLSTSSFASIKSNRAPPPPPVTIPVAARTPGVVAAPDSAPGSAASSIRSTEKKHGHKKSNSISRKPVPAMDPDLLSDSELLTHTPARKSSLRRVVGAGVSPQPAASQSVGGETELLAAPEALIAPPPRDSSRTSTPRIPPSPAFGTPPNLAAALDIDGGMLQSVSPSPKARSVGSPSGSSSSSPLVRAASVRESPRLASPALLERSRSLRAREVGTEVLAGPGRSVHGVDLAAVGSDVVGVAPASPAPASSALSRRPQTPQSQIRTLEDIASPRSVLSSPHSGEGLDILEASAVASAQAVTATPAHARVLSLSNGQVRAITPESSNSGRTRPTSSPVSPSRRIPGHAKSASESGTSMPNRSPALESGHSKSASTSETHTLQRGLGFGVLGQDREDEVERITVDDDVPIGSPEASSKAASTASPGSRHVIDLGSAGSTPVQAVTANMPMQSSPRRHQHELPPLPPAARGQLAPPMSSSSAGTAPTPHVVRHKTSSKFRLPFRSPRPPADDEDLSPPMSPTSARLRTHSITNAFRRRRNTNSGTPPGSPPVRSSLVSSNSTSEDHSTLPYEYGLQGLGLSSFALAPSAYRTPSGGIGYTPPKMERKLSLTAQEAFASARERHAIEQAQQLEAFRKSEKARTMSHTSSANPASRVTSVAMSSEFMSDDSHYDNASDELPQSLSLAMVTAAGSNPVASPVEQLAAAASAARQHRQEARYSPSSPTAGDEGAADRQRAREAALAQQRRLSVGDREDEFHDAVSQLDDDHDYSDSNSDSELELNGFDDDVEANEVAEREAAELAAAERAELAEREQREAAQREEARRLDLEVAEAAKRAAEEQRLQEEQESARAEEHRLQEEQEMALAAETRRLEKERLRLEAARMEQERLAAKEEEDHLAALLRAEEEERRVAADEQRRLQEEREAEEARLVQERRLAEMEERLAAQQEEARLAAEREAEREAAELAEAERLKAERVEQERAAAASAKAEQERIERAARERDEVTRQLQGGKAEGGIMLRGWVTVQTMNSPTWRRRYFHLLASELRLFKSDSENDTAKALTTVGLSGAKISEAYEESAVQGSWKLETGGKEYYMFADGAEDRATVLQGLAIAIA
ncbi:hypothetical protein CC85DRAFT_285505 [Cutaneotrichosporon oleaginosum]|uniref:PH domain-containing protein n=1 Tax=Cutaneotrichosporon oleaginosum TaxID=879819 RepID=A0A0J0XMT1_9TREE|nr:uncharacterized protein CC85DRAFT_285505 [Cutaneotrichosporon oleaginosum]KLT42406.1 hypothetical protein CC85DRAFT_285505 [Cutaneotrichosporon oleaginosum]TXT06925.1 hypothetical protein COLE_06256 [Cutaneotrichosporon oleaginosum]